jgi:ubiquinone/menaquinone biosynthesis C-methylase UbiE
VYAWKDYWANLARSYGSVDPESFAPVLHPDAPTWFNSTIDRMQEESWRRGLSRCRLIDHASVLDIGCGTGRWSRRYLQLGHRPVGLDATQGMLRLATATGLACPLIVAHAQRLPFRDSSFELASAVTVVQHIPSSDQRDVLKEMVRVLRPGGHLILIELIRGKAPHIFPRSCKNWVETAASVGLSVVYTEGQEYLLFDQAFVKFVQALLRLARNRSGSVLPGQDGTPAGGAKYKSAGKSLYWSGRRISCKLSEWVEPLVRKICPSSWATHGLFVFLKKNGIE